MHVIQLTPTQAPVSAGEAITRVPRLTAHDALDRILDHWGTGPQKLSQREAKRAILDAYRELATAAQWSYLYTFSRLNLNGVYQDGTVEYQHTGGSHERQLTLTGGTWPSWATFGFLRIDAGIVYKVARRISATVLQLDEVMNPGLDIAAGQPYVLARDTYELPADFIAGENPTVENAWGGLTYVRPALWARRVRYDTETYSDPRWYTFTGENGRLVMQINPPADRDQTLDLVYYRRGRQINVWEYTMGKASVDAAGAANLVTISGGEFTRKMVGSVIRLSDDAKNLPTGLEGDHPAAAERTIHTFVNSQMVAVDEGLPQNFTAVAFRVSDPIDFEELQMNAFWRCVERQGAIQRIARNQVVADQAYRTALLLAREADTRVLARRAAGGGRSYRRRLADMPVDFSQE